MNPSRPNPATPKPASNVLKTSEVARFWRVDPKTVRGWIATRGFPAFYTPGGHARHDVAKVTEWAREHGEALPPAFEALLPPVPAVAA
jgi:hypothetical protein